MYSESEEKGLHIFASEGEPPLFSATIESLSVMKTKWILGKSFQKHEEKTGEKHSRYLSMPPRFLGSRWLREGPSLDEVTENPDLKQYRKTHWVVPGVLEVRLNVESYTPARYVNHVMRGFPRELVLEALQEADLDPYNRGEMERWKKLYLQTMEDGARFRIFPLVSICRQNAEGTIKTVFGGKIYPRTWGKYGPLSPVFLDAHAFGDLVSIPWEDIRNACATTELFIAAEFMERGIKIPWNMVYLGENYVLQEGCSLDGSPVPWFFDLNTGPKEDDISLRIWPHNNRLVALLPEENDPVPIEEAQGFLESRVLPFSENQEEEKEQEEEA
jgi:hypothetical protein